MPLEKVLAHTEALLGNVQTALLAADPIHLEQATQQLHSTAVALAQMHATLRRQPTAEPWPPSGNRRTRIQAVVAELNLLRASLARSLALVERQSASLLPPAPQYTYACAAHPPGIFIHE